MQFSEQQQEATSGPHLIIHRDRRALRVVAIAYTVVSVPSAAISFGQIAMGNSDLFSVIVPIGCSLLACLFILQAWQYFRLLASDEPALVANQEGILLIKYGPGKSRVMLPWSKIEKIAIEYGAPGSRLLCIHLRNLLSNERGSSRWLNRRIYTLSKEFLDRTIEEIFQQLYDTYGHELSRYNVQLQQLPPK